MVHANWEITWIHDFSVADDFISEKGYEQLKK